MAFKQRQLVFAGAVGVDRDQVLDDLRQRLGQQPVIDQIQHQPHCQRTQHARDKDDSGIDQKAFTVIGRVQRDAQVAVILAVGAAAYQLSGEAAFLAKDEVCQPPRRGRLQRPVFLGEQAFVRVPDGRHAHGVILEQAFDDLHAHLAVQAVDGLCRRIAEHAENPLGVARHSLTCLVGVEDDLRTAEQDAYQKRRKQHNAQQLYRQAVLEFQLQWPFLS